MKISFHFKLKYNYIWKSQLKKTTSDNPGQGNKERTHIYKCL